LIIDQASIIAREFGRDYRNYSSNLLGGASPYARFDIRRSDHRTELRHSPALPPTTPCFAVISFSGVDLDIASRRVTRLHLGALMNLRTVRTRLALARQDVSSATAAPPQLYLNAHFPRGHFAETPPVNACIDDAPSRGVLVPDLEVREFSARIVHRAHARTMSNPRRSGYFILLDATLLRY